MGFLQDWDAKKLLAKLQEQGLPVNTDTVLKNVKELVLPMVEKGAVKSIDALFDWADESIKASDTKIDDMFLGLLPMARAAALKWADKIASADHSEIKQAIVDAHNEVIAAFSAQNDQLKSEVQGNAGQDQQLASNPIQALPTA